MQHRHLLAILLCLAATGLKAQTDVTSQYLTNAGFDDSSSWTTATVGQNTKANVQGWTPESTGDTWFYGAAVAATGGPQVNGSSAPGGTCQGGALALSVGWGCTLAYKQHVDLPAGRYRISFKVSNANTTANQFFNYMGFVEDSGTTHYAPVSNVLCDGASHDIVLTLELLQPTSGYVSVGMGAVSGGSGDNAKLYVDKVVLEAYNAAETLMPGQTFTAGQWTGNTGTYQGTYPEHYEENHYTGDVMSCTTAVPNGNYEVDLAFQAHMAWISQAAPDGTPNAYIKAGSLTLPVGIVNNVAFTAYEPTTYHLDDVVVSGGQLTISVGNKANGANWLTVGQPVITQLTTPAVSYGAFPMPADGQVKDGYWYQVVLPSAGYYSVACTEGAALFYSQNASATTEEVEERAANGERIKLNAGKLYAKLTGGNSFSLKLLQAIDPLADVLYKVGDVDADGDLDIDDTEALALLVKANAKPDTRNDVNQDGLLTVADEAKLIDILLGHATAVEVDERWRYADIEATVYTEQSASENASASAYMVDRATCSLNSADIKDSYNNFADFVTTLNVSTTLPNVESVSIMATGKQAIAGPMTIALRGDDIRYSYAKGDEQALAHCRYLQSDVVTVTGKDAGTYTAYLYPVSLPQGVIVTVRTADGKFYSQSFADVRAGKANELMFTASTASGNWMATIPGNTNWSMISTPGSHDAATSGVTGVTANYAKCQSDNLATQLANGVRCFDIRPGYKLNTTITADNLYIYHGTYNTNVLYKDAIKIFADFLEQHPTEAITIVMVKESNSGTDRSSEMWTVVKAVQEQYRQYMHLLDHSYYTLDDFRGKICYINRTGTDVPYTTRITNWPDDATVSNYNCAIGSTCFANVQDAYNTNGANKQTMVKDMLGLSSANTNRARFHFNYTSSAYKLAGKAPLTYAKATNPVIASYLSDGNISGPTGYILGDDMGASSNDGFTLLKAIVEQNYRYVFNGRSRVR